MSQTQSLSSEDLVQRQDCEVPSASAIGQDPHTETKKELHRLVKMLWVAQRGADTNTEAKLRLQLEKQFPKEYAEFVRVEQESAARFAAANTAYLPGVTDVTPAPVQAPEQNDQDLIDEFSKSLERGINHRVKEYRHGFESGGLGIQPDWNFLKKGR